MSIYIKVMRALKNFIQRLFLSWELFHHGYTQRGLSEIVGSQSSATSYAIGATVMVAMDPR